MEKQFHVVVHFEGAMSYTVNAKSQEEAEKIAENMFESESDSKICANIGDSEVCDCWEE